MKRTFKSFPKESTCPICNTNADKECFLLPIDGTEDGNICEAQPTHVACFQFDEFRLNKDHGVIYRSL